MYVRYETRWYWRIRIRHAWGRVWTRTRPWAWLLLLPPLAAVGFVPRACSALDVATHQPPSSSADDPALVVNR